MGLNISLEYKIDESELSQIRSEVFEPILRILKANKMKYPWFYGAGRACWYDFTVENVRVLIWSRHPLIGLGDNRNAYRQIKALLKASRFIPSYEHIWL